MTSERTARRGLTMLLALLLVAGILWRAQAPAPRVTAGGLPPPPPVPLLKAVALGEPVPLAGILSLWVMTAGDAPGGPLPFARLDYARLEAWLDTLLALDPGAHAPLLAASHIYSQVPDPKRQRRMLEFVYRATLADPDRRWRWLAHAALVAKHRLHDPPLALRYARAVARHAHGPGVPAWARELPVFILEEMGETEAARIEIRTLLAGGSISDAAERRFLMERLLALEAQSRGAAENPTPASKTRHPDLLPP